MSLCPTADVFAELAAGTLSPEEAERARYHAAGCSRCTMVLQGLASAHQLFEGEPLVMKPGALVGRFRLERLMGRGGMGSVWAAADPELGREVAIKVLFTGLGSDGDQAASRARLLREAQAMARLSHPNVVPVFEIGEVQQRLFLVMELVQGQTLAQWLKEPRARDEVLEKFLAAGEGLAAAHAAGVIHRDFKPENVLVGDDGRARVTDFGLARGQLQELGGGAQAESRLEATPAELESPTTPSPLTPMGALLGTPAYMSPEQMHGERADARSDLFAYCTALFEALVGARPYPAKTLLEMRNRIEAGALEWPAEPRVPRWLRLELARGLRADPLQRHASMAELLAALRRGRASRERRISWLAPALALLLIVAAGLAGLWRRAPPPKPVRAVAVLAPRNASPNDDAGWIAAALAELIAGDLGGDPRVRLVPASEVAAAAADLDLRGASPLASDVPRLRTRLAADLVLGGKYTLGADGKLVCELALWDAQGNATLLSVDGDEAHLLAVGLRLGSEVRRALGMSAATPPGAGAFPTNLEAARLYAEGLQLLRNYEPALAAEPLKKARALSPENPRVQLALAEAYAILRQEEPARQAAQRAFEFKSGLSPEEQARAEILYRRNSGDAARAIELARASHLAEPDDLRRGLELAEELTLDHRGKEALAVSAELHKLPPPAGNDARIDLLEAQSCALLGDFKCAVAASARAYAMAQQRGARWQMAVARYRAGFSIRKQGDAVAALEMLREAEQLYAAVGDKGGAAGASMMMATVYADRGDLPRAREVFESALATFGAIGDRPAEGVVLHNLAVLMRRARELPAALAYAGRATTVNLELGQSAPAASAMTTLGNLRLDMADLAGAAEVLTRAATLRRQAKSSQLALTLAALASVRLLQADLPEVRRLLDEARAGDNGQDKLNSGRLHSLAAQLALAEKRPADAATEAGLAASIFKDGSMPDDQALVEATSARALLALGRAGDARAAEDRALALISTSKSQLARTPVAVVDALLRAAEHPREPAEPLRSLRAVAEEASRTGAQDEQWQARLAIGEIEVRSDSPGARKRLLALAQDARAQGLMLYAQEAEEAAQAVR